MKLIFETFDSAVLDSNVGRILFPENPVPDLDSFIPAYKNFLENHAIKILHAQTPFIPQNITFLQNLSFNLVSSKASYVLAHNITPTQRTLPENFTLTTEQEYVFDLSDPDIIDLINTVSSISHYAIDPHCNHDWHTKIYTQWFKNSFNGYANKIFIIQHNHEIAGIITLKQTEETVVIDLLSVRKKYQGLGLATHLINQAIGYAVTLGKQLHVHTQAENIPANKTYQKSGFMLANIALYYHKIF
jgi:ribosomal protein S18 acetylase RimI-like enzyme